MKRSKTFTEAEIKKISLRAAKKIAGVRKDGKDSMFITNDLLKLLANGWANMIAREFLEK